jgi:hypothetical protein
MPQMQLYNDLPVAQSNSQDTITKHITAASFSIPAKSSFTITHQYTVLQKLQKCHTNKKKSQMCLKHLDINLPSY